MAKIILSQLPDQEEQLDLEQLPDQAQPTFRERVGEAAQAGIERFQRGKEEIKEATLAPTFGEHATRAVRGISALGAGALETAAAPVTAAVEKGMSFLADKPINPAVPNSPTFREVGQAIPEPVKQKLAQGIEAIPEDQRNVFEDLLIGLGAIEGGAALIAERGAIKKGVTSLAKEGADIAKKGAKETGEFLAERRQLINDAKIDVDEITGQIVQGKKKDIPKAKRALSQLDTKDVQTYEELSNVADDRISALSEKMDEFLLEDTTPKQLDDLAKTVKVGERKVTQNFVDDAMNHLEELYEKTGALEEMATIQNLRDKAVNEGLSMKEINDLSREYGITFGKKAFNKVGDPLTSVNAVKFENTRKGIKNAVRSNLTGDTAKAIDSSISDLFTVKQLTEKMTEKVNALSQKVQKRGVAQKLARSLANVVDTATLGAPKAFFNRLFVRSNLGDKILNAIDLEKALQKNLRKLDIVNKATDDDLVKMIKKEAVKSNIRR
jgi:hypothetical protein